MCNRYLNGATQVTLATVLPAGNYTLRVEALAARTANYLVSQDTVMFLQESVPWRRHQSGEALRLLIHGAKAYPGCGQRFRANTRSSFKTENEALAGFPLKLTALLIVQ